MARQTLAAKSPTGASAPAQKFSLHDLWRLTLWGLAAGGALTIAVYAGTTPTGQRRLAFAAAQARESFHPSGTPPSRTLDSKDGQQIAESLRALTVDRDRMMARLAKLERSLDDVTASTSRAEKPASSAPVPAPMPIPSRAAGSEHEPQAGQSEQAGAAAASAPPTEETAAAPAQRPAIVPAADDVLASLQRPAGVPVPPPAPATPGKLEFGLDLGGAHTMDGVRNLWATARSRHGPLLEGLRPLVHARERRPSVVDLRLVVGPIPNAATAARMCATIAAAGALCQPSVFRGQRLAIR